VHLPTASPPAAQAASDASDDLDAVSALRGELTSLSSPPRGTRERLARYYRTLCLMESRFPISHADGHVQLAFAWLDAFK
jgi:programmed cell death 6-interacting protein